MKILQKMKINQRIFWLLLLCLLVSSSMIFQTSRIAAQKTIEDFLYNYVKLNLDNIESSLEFSIHYVNMLSVRLLIHNEIYNLLLDPSELSAAEKQSTLTRMFNSMMIDRDIVGEIFIITEDGNVYRQDEETFVDQPDQSYIREIQQSNVPIWGRTKKDADGNAYILLGRKYQNFYTGQRLGYLVIYIKERAIQNVLKNMIVEDRGYSFLVTGDSYVLSYPEPRKVGTTIFDEEIYRTEKGENFKRTELDGIPSIIASYPLGGALKNLGLDWRVISVISHDKLMEKVDKIRSYALFIQLAALLIIILISIYVSRGVIKPIKRLTRKINYFDDAYDYIAAFRNEKDELSVLENSFNEMVIRIKELIERNNEEKDRQREKELIALQAQINPHFLYNTLDAIGWLAKIHNQSIIERMVIALANFYRLCLHKGDKYITVEEEIGIVKSYVAIEDLRFPDKFTLEFDIAEDILHLKILKIIIQPLVENAIKHGISRKRGKGHIVVKGSRIGERIRFEVVDDGAGFDVKKLNAGIEESSYRGGGYGIRNVHERIQLEYGNAYGIEILSEPGSGTSSILTVEVKHGI